MMPETLDAIRAHAVGEYPREACGLVVILKGRERYIPCRNMAETANDHFVLSPEDYAAAEDQGEITAIVHSHPDGAARASEGDRVACEGSKLPWYIISVLPGAQAPEAGEINRIAPEGYQAPLVGRQFHH